MSTFGFSSFGVLYIINMLETPNQGTSFCDPGKKRSVMINQVSPMSYEIVQTPLYKLMVEQGGGEHIT